MIATVPAAGLPLAGLRVADFTAALAGPLATMCLADLGADVVKIEDANRGDMAREVAPWIFVALNRNKRSIGLDLRTPEGRQVARRIALDCDVVVSSFRPGVMRSFGLDASDLLADRPSLVYARLSGFGEDGPKSHRRAMDLTIRAESGLIAAGATGTPGIAIVDWVAGMMFAQAILAAVMRRDKTGAGAVLDGRLLDAGVFLQAVRIAEHSSTGANAGETRSPTVGVYSASDGDLVIAVYYDRDWRRLCEALGQPELADERRFASHVDRLANADELRAIIARAVAVRPRHEWTEILDGAGVMAGRVNAADELYGDAQLVHNGLFHDAPEGGGPAVTLVRLPFAIDGDPLPLLRPAPRLNDAGPEILRGLGYSEEQISALDESGVTTTRSSGPPGT